LYRLQTIFKAGVFKPASNGTDMGTNLENNLKSIEILNDLIEISNDRVKHYKKAIAALREEDEDLKPLFTEMIHESHRHKAELSEEVRLLGGDPESGVAASGTIYLAWRDLKAGITGSARGNILSNCEFGENAAQNAYDTAVDAEGVNNGLRNLLYDQRNALSSSYDYIRSLNDQLT
jgi:uncharacterized protein (TIGR02284 family)